MLKGSVRQVMSFIGGHWMPLLQLSVAPVLMLTAVNLVALHFMRGFVATLTTFTPGSPPRPEFLQSMMEFQAYNLAASLVSVLLMTWLFVRIVRYYALGELNWASFAPAGVKPVLLTFLYGIGISLLTLVAYIGGLLAILLPAALIAALAGEAGGAVAALLSVIGVCAVLVFLLWFFCRFAVGLPGVALGGSPDFFKGMWPLARSNGFGLPLRIIGSYVALFLVLAPIYALVFWLMLGKAEMLGIDPDGQLRPEQLVELFDWIYVFVVIGMLIQIPISWYFSLLFAEAYRRFNTKPLAAT